MEAQATVSDREAVCALGLSKAGVGTRGSRPGLQVRAQVRAAVDTCTSLSLPASCFLGVSS